MMLNLILHTVLPWEWVANDMTHDMIGDSMSLFQHPLQTRDSHEVQKHSQCKLCTNLGQSPFLACQ